MDNESLHPDLEGTPCAVSDCIRVSDVVAHATIEVSPLVGATPADSRPVIDVPLCVDHAHLLRMGTENALLEFSSRL